MALNADGRSSSCEISMFPFAKGSFACVAISRTKAHSKKNVFANTTWNPRFVICDLHSVSNSRIKRGHVHLGLIVCLILVHELVHQKISEDAKSCFMNAS